MLKALKFKMQTLFFTYFDFLSKDHQLAYFNMLMPISFGFAYIIVLSLFDIYGDQRTSYPPTSRAILFRMYSISLATVSKF